MTNETGIYISFFAYAVAMLLIGVYFYWKSQKDISSYFIGSRSVGPWVTALSAQASDMSAWLFMSLPGAAYLFGYQSAWIVFGLALGTYLNWKIIARRLRNFSICFGDSITIPEYLQNRFQSNSPTIRLICSIVILVFFLLYVASGFSAQAKLFEELFDMNYRTALFLGAFIILLYTYLGGFMAVCWTDFFQGILMFFGLILVPVILFGKLSAADLAPVFSPKYITSTLFSSQSNNQWGEVISGLGWGIGYFGMPHILVRFMAARSSKEISLSRRIAIVWVCLTLVAAFCIGLLGKIYLAKEGIIYEDQAMAERVFMKLSAALFNPWIAGIFFSSLLAAVMSTISSQLLVLGSAVINDIYNLFKKKKDGEASIFLSRLSIVVAALISIMIAWFPDNTVMDFVSYAWAGFGATFSPVILLSLVWKRLTVSGALSGLISGTVGVLLWESFDLHTVIGVYSIVPCFILSFLVIIGVSLLDKKPSEEIVSNFNKASKM